MNDGSGWYIFFISRLCVVSTDDSVYRLGQMTSKVEKYPESLDVRGTKIEAKLTAGIEGLL